jgi:hypothetical protein
VKSFLASHPFLAGVTVVVLVAGLAIGGVAVARRGSTTAHRGSTTTTPSTAAAALARQPSFTTVERAVCAAIGPTDSEGDHCAILSMKVSARNPQWVLAQGVGYYAHTGPPSPQNSRSDLDQVIFNLRTRTLIGPTNVGFCNSAAPADLSQVPMNVLAGWGLGGCSTGAASTTTATFPTTRTTATSPPTTAGAAGFAGLAGTWGAHEASLVISNSGTLCPSCSNASAPTSTVDFTLKPVTTGTANGTVVASSDPKNYTVGESVMVTLKPGSPGQLLDVKIGGMDLLPFCNSTSAGQCGA